MIILFFLQEDAKIVNNILKIKLERLLLLIISVVATVCKTDRTNGQNDEKPENCVAF